MSDMDHPHAAYLQGIGVGIGLGGFGILATGDWFIYPMAFVGAVFVMLGYYTEKRSVDTDTEDSP